LTLISKIVYAERVHVGEEDGIRASPILEMCCGPLGALERKEEALAVSGHGDLLAVIRWLVG
jgi:hypothetical protein